MHWQKAALITQRSFHERPFLARASITRRPFVTRAFVARRPYVTGTFITRRPFVNRRPFTIQRPFITGRPFITHRALVIRPFFARRAFINGTFMAKRPFAHARPFITGRPFLPHARPFIAPRLFVHGAHPFVAAQSLNVVMQPLSAVIKPLVMHAAGLTAGKISLFAAIIFTLGSGLAIAIPRLSAINASNGSRPNGATAPSSQVGSGTPVHYSGPSLALGNFHYGSEHFDGEQGQAVEGNNDPPAVFTPIGDRNVTKGVDVGRDTGFLNGPPPAPPDAPFGSHTSLGGRDDVPPYSAFADTFNEGGGGGGGTYTNRGTEPISTDGSGSPGDTGASPSQSQAPVPVPSGFWLLVPGLSGLIAFRKKIAGPRP